MNIDINLQGLRRQALVIEHPNHADNSKTVDKNVISHICHGTVVACRVTPL
jgi:hypothetical protein